MRILVVDDNKNHREAAKVLSPEHDVVICDWNETWEGKFDVALLDLLMPAQIRHVNGGTGELFSEAPIGIFHALRLAREGVPLIAIYSDANHHLNPFVAAMEDAVQFSVGTDVSEEYPPTPLMVNGAILFCLTRYGVASAESDKIEEKYPEYAGLNFELDQFGKAVFKDWKKILRSILAHQSKAKSAQSASA